MALKLDAIVDNFTNATEGGLYIEKVNQGTILDAMDIVEGYRGTQDLNTISVTPVWKTTAGDEVTDANVTPFSGVGDSDVDLGAPQITVGVEFFQAPVNPYIFDETFLRSKGSYVDPEMAAASQAVEAAVRQGRAKMTDGFFEGLGASSPTNGLNDITANTVATTASETILQQLADMHATVAASAIGGDADQVIILNAADYVAYRQALRTAGLNDVLQTTVTETGLMMSPWIDDPRVTVIGDAVQQSDEEARWTSKDNLVIATASLRDHEQPELFYDKLSNAWYLRAFASIGVQAYSNGASGLLYENNPS